MTFQIRKTCCVLEISSARDHENMAVVEVWPLVKIRPYFFCASREGASQHGKRKHSSLKEQVSRGSERNCIVEG